MTDNRDRALDDDAFLDAFFDTIIPPGDTMPGAGTLCLGPRIRDQVAATPMFERPLEAALSALCKAALERADGGLPALDAEARKEVVAAVMAQQPVLGMSIALVYMAYYQEPVVLEALGQRGGPPFPQGHRIETTDESLLRKLRAK